MTLGLKLYYGGTLLTGIGVASTEIGSFVVIPIFIGVAIILHGLVTLADL